MKKRGDFSPRFRILVIVGHANHALDGGKFRFGGCGECFAKLNDGITVLAARAVCHVFNVDVVFRNDARDLTEGGGNILVEQTDALGTRVRDGDVGEIDAVLDVAAGENSSSSCAAIIAQLSSDS